MSLDKLMKIRGNEVIVVGDFNIDLIAVNGSWRIFRDAGMKQIRSINELRRKPMQSRAPYAKARIETVE